MTEENKFKQSLDDPRPPQASDAQPSQEQSEHDERHALGVQAQRDEEIEAIDRKSVV